MRGKSHLTFGITTGLITSVLLLPRNSDYEYILFAGSTAIASLLPDIDLKTSTIGKKVPLLSGALNKMFGHRGFLHSPLFGILIAYLFHHLGFPILFYSWILGYFGHLLLDMCTQGGIPLLYPFSRSRFRFFKIKSGSFWEYFILVFLIITYICLLSFLIWKGIISIMFL